jgi:tRNA-dihydrouridine synthase B
MLVIMFNWSRMKKPIIALSPMADMTDSAFCRIAKRFAAPVVFREMISAEGLVHGSGKSFEMGRFEEEERPIIQQLFGAHPQSMADAVKMIDEAYSPDGFDINMGCPVYKIVSNFNGAALMRDPQLATAVIRAMIAATTKPVSVKIRLGWSDPTECLEFVKVIEAAGAALITIHGRTKAQGYSGIADWEMVGRAAANVSIPVLCNGDVHTAEAAPHALEDSKCAGLMIARGALGNPWIFAQIEDALAGRPVVRPTLAGRIAVVRDHGRLHAELHGGDLVSFRKHLTWYFKGVRGAKAFRERLMKISATADLDATLDDYLAAEDGHDAAASEPDRATAA